MTKPIESEITTLKVDVGIIKSQMVDMKGQNDRIEKKIDGMTYASVTDVAEAKAVIEAFKQEVKETYATKESVDPMRRVVYGLVGVILVGTVAAVLKLVTR